MNVKTAIVTTLAVAMGLVFWSGRRWHGRPSRAQRGRRPWARTGMRALTIRGYGHTEFINPSTCVIGYEVSYLLTGLLPPVGTICPQNAVPFPSPA